jgi:hypothetical protein
VPPAGLARLLLTAFYSPPQTIWQSEMVLRHCLSGTANQRIVFMPKLYGELGLEPIRILFLYEKAVLQRLTEEKRKKILSFEPSKFSNCESY